MKRQLARTVLWFCILLFLAIWYQIISKIACNLICEVEQEEQQVVVAYEDMTPEQRRAEFEKLKAMRAEEK